MPKFRTHQRSSDSVDFEHTAALKELEELTLTGTEHTSSSEQSPQPAKDAAILHFPGARALARTPPVNPAQALHSNTAMPGVSVIEKITVFKDEGRTTRRPIKVANCSAESVAISNTLRTRGKHSRSTSDTTVSHVTSTPITLSQPGRGEASNISNKNDGDGVKVAAGSSTLVRKLQDIAIRRAKLINEFTALEAEEAATLTQLAQSTDIKTRLETSKAHIVEAVPTPLPSNTVTRTPARPLSRPSKATQARSMSKAALTRPVSAPPKSTPSGPRHRALSTSKRIPLTDKTEDVLATIDTTPLYAKEWNASPVKPEDTTTTKAAESTPSPLKRGRITRVPTKFGDGSISSEDVGTINQFSVTSGKLRGRESRNSSRGRSKSRSVNSSENWSRNTTSPSTPAARPDIARSYDIPPTVSRKRWDF
ncbi:uncharacterized protein K460DRAFT_406260 [Cucurbitaria berberidis CBS 394.84]|uniref:Uncharacterized protein n=1 Tax=Cucurbitaria berberidis CBS 394.84 TaxID=1168544 RepID=A0A9P4L8H2_9PLEO|nr:uncharacterized protein K460DRAFT_406260 [Cucurbitaria berberidis CBS 394.84]KAF1846035.1 hypothetical protein K460DRAFT_406260 [Cucurbitaria berberidis CBS 394.84]